MRSTDCLSFQFLGHHIPDGKSPPEVSELFPETAIHLLNHLCVRYDQAIHQTLIKKFSKRVHTMNYGMLAFTGLPSKHHTRIQHLLREHLGTPLRFIEVFGGSSIKPSRLWSLQLVELS